jgi:hypothetical protein
MSARWAEGREDPRLAVIVRAGGRGSHAVVAETVVGHGQVRILWSSRVVVGERDGEALAKREELVSPCLEVPLVANRLKELLDLARSRQG